MTYATERPDDLDASGRGRMTAKVLAHVGFVAGAFGFLMYAVAGSPLLELAVASVDQAASAPAPALQTAPAPRADRVAQAHSTVLDYRPLPANSRLLNADFALGPRPTLISQSILVPASFEVAMADPSDAEPAEDDATAALPPMPLPRPTLPQATAEVPLPPARPAEARTAANPGPTRQEIAEPNKAVALANPAPEAPQQDSLFQKLFGKLRAPTLAFASPDGGIFSDGSSITPGKYDRYTAVYDISAKTVYMPDGRKLEAHSGLGARLDDPRYVHERMRGATPPHLYDLSLREKLFHGVRAIRLKPVGGESAVYGRTGLLAHTFMLGPNGDSNGCVSFRDYNAFLRAFESGQIKRLAVVSRLS